MNTEGMCTQSVVETSLLVHLCTTCSFNTQSVTSGRGWPRVAACSSLVGRVEERIVCRARTLPRTHTHTHTRARTFHGQWRRCQCPPSCPGVPWAPESLPCATQPQTLLPFAFARLLPQDATLPVASTCWLDLLAACEALLLLPPLLRLLSFAPVKQQSQQQQHQ
jgi:hypothetical protein